jgi:anti-sigma regulatory factor (Ser/Thr protein kinase)
MTAGECHSEESKRLETGCQYSKIVIPGDPAYAGIAATYAGAVAEKLGFERNDLEDIRQCTERIVAWAIHYSLAENERTSIEVACQVIPEGFKIAVNDRGVPFEPSMVKDAGSNDLSGIFNLEGHMDEIRFNNLGPGGKEIILIKYSQNGLITDLYNACELESYETETPPAPARARDEDVVVRPMLPDEAIEVSKCVYKGYGYTYPHEHVYYPAKLVELNRNNRMFSAVAVSGQGDIVGHCALLFESPDNRIAEMGLGIVKPEYRGLGCFNRLTAFLIAKAQSDGLSGLYVRAVAVHKYSQRAAARFALKETALLSAYIPPTVDFRRVGRQGPQRVTTFLCFRHLTSPSRPLIYPPASHRNIIISLYDHLGVQPVVESPAALEETVFDPESRVHVKIVQSMGSARIVIEGFGRNILREISQSVTELCLNKIEVLNLYTDLSDPRIGWVTERMEEIGFFFAGVLPGGMPKGSDALILQYLNNIIVDYDEVQAHSPMARRLVDYVGGRNAAVRGPGRFVKR